MKILRIILSICFALGLWQAVVMITDLPKFLLPSPSLVAQTWWESRALIAEHSLYTLSEILLGLLIGTIFGIATALYLALSRSARLLIEPILIFTQTLPVFALAPILTLWMGYGIWSKVAVAVLIIYFPITAAFLDGLMRPPQGYLDLAKTMQASPIAILRKIRIPHALPSLASGLRLAAVYAPIGAVIGEWVGASRGLGFLMIIANGRAKTDLMFAAMLSLGVLSIILHRIVYHATQRMITKTNT